MPQRTVRVESFTVSDLTAGEYPAAHFQVKCSSGTYIRSLAADLGKLLGCPAHLESLRRTRVGRFNVVDSFTIEELQKNGIGTEEAPLTAMADALEMPEYTASSEEVQLILTGRAVSVSGRSETPLDGTVIKMLAASDGGLLGLGKVVAGTIKPFVVVREV
jgi:tRNA pseudouridine55 synthase